MLTFFQVNPESDGRFAHLVSNKRFSSSKQISRISSSNNSNFILAKKMNCTLENFMLKFERGKVH